MKLLVAVVAGALIGVSAVAGKLEPEAEMGQWHSVSGTNGAARDAVAVGVVIEALRAGDVIYDVSSTDNLHYVPPRPPL